MCVEELVEIQMVIYFLPNLWLNYSLFFKL